MTTITKFLLCRCYNTPTRDLLHFRNSYNTFLFFPQVPQHSSTHCYNYEIFRNHTFRSRSTLKLPQPGVTIITTCRLSNIVNATRRITHNHTLQGQHIREDTTQLDVTIMTKKTIQINKTLRKPRRPAVTITTTTRKLLKRVTTPQRTTE